MSLATVAVTGLKWSTFAKIFKQFFQFIVLIVLAKLLSVEDFGLVGTTMIYIGFLQIIQDLGISSAIIQKDEISKILFSTIFWVNVLFGIILSLIVIILAPFIASYYSEPRLVLIMSVIAVSFIISSFTIAQRALLEKKLKFNILSKIEIAGSLIGGVVGIVMALLHFGVWSLIFQAITNITVSSIMLWIFSDLKPNFAFSLKEIKSVASFSLNLTGFNILNYFVRNSDYFFISSFLGMEALGFYSLAYRIMLYPIQNITQIISRVMFPIYSKIKHNNLRFRKIYTKVANAIAIITFPMMLGLMSVSDYFVPVVLGEKWKPLIGLLLILAPLGLIQSVYTTAGSIFLAKGHTNTWFKWGIFTSVIFVTGFYFGLQWGIMGVAYAYLISNLIVLYPGLSIPFKYIEFSFSIFVKSFYKTFLSSLLMVFSVLLVKYIISNYYISELEKLIVLIFTGIISYLWFSFILNKNNLKDIYTLIRIKNII